MSRLLSVCMVVSLVGAAAGAEKPAAAALLTFESHVRPLFKVYCLDCHGEGEKLRGGLDLRLRRLTVQGGDSGPAVDSGKPADSLLLQRVRDGEMPPGTKKKLSPTEVEVIARWVAAGAPSGASRTLVPCERNAHRPGRPCVLGLPAGTPAERPGRSRR